MYDLALSLSPDFAMALGNRGQAVAGLVRYSQAHRARIAQEAYWNLWDATRGADDVLRVGGQMAVDRFFEMLGRFPDPPTERPPVSPIFSDPYQEWCRSHGLFLHLSPFCLKEGQRTWDPLYFRSAVTVPPLGETPPSGVPATFGAFNTLKNEYTTARFLAWVALADSPLRGVLREVGTHTRYIDTRDEATYDLATGIARQAFQAGNNLLDKIGTLLSLFLGIRGINSFERWWKVSGKRRDYTLHPLVIDAIRASDDWGPGLWALCDLSADLEEGGRYFDLQCLRHAATHKFVFQHQGDAGEPPNFRQPVVRISAAEAERLLIQQLQVARSAMVYTVEVIDARRAQDTATDQAPLKLSDWQHPQ
ncbi:MAG: LA2681 family HEPN domain-containing protein [Candidatus Dormiibacterota bacterium]